MNYFNKSTYPLIRSSVIRRISDHSRHEVLIIGGGTAGSSMANRLGKAIGERNVAVVEPSSYHYYQPLWTLVGAGIRSLQESIQPVNKILPTGVTLYEDKVTQLEPGDSFVVLSSGAKVYYRYLILALGMTLRYDMIAGAEEALDKDPRVCSNYSPLYVNKTFPAYQNFQHGNAVFTLPSGPIKCAGAPQKVMYLFDDFLRKVNKRADAQFHYFTATNKLFSVDKYSNNLAQICKERDINCNLSHNLIGVDSVNSEAVFENVETRTTQRIKFDLLHITPPMTVPDVLKATPKLTSPQASDYVAVDTKTLRHLNFPNIFALGDCAALPTSKTAAAVASQANVLESNLCDIMAGGAGRVLEYDGYTACPLVTGYNRGIIAEFDYTMQPLETLPFDQGKERYLHYIMKAFLFPPLYWDWLIRGFWSGPSKMRQLLHLGRSN